MLINEITVKKGKQVKAKSKKPKLVKPSTGHESPHPFRGMLVGENTDIPFNKCPKCQGPIFHEAEGKKDACYHKVKSRYKVWPSAYASGALVQCRKKGAKNWGNKSKKK